MRRAGTVVSIAQGTLVLRAADADIAGIGAPVVDDRLTNIGRIVDVFGPVDAPYLVVTPTADIDLPDHLGDILYLRE